MNAIYLSIFNILTLIFTILVSSIDKKRIVIILTIPYSFFIALFINLRDYNYGDTVSYVNYYIRDYKVLDFEPFYEVINYVFRIFHPTDPLFMFVFISFLTVFVINFSLLKILPIKEALIVIWTFSSFFSFYYFTFETIRDGLGYAFLIYSFTYLINNVNIKKYLLCVFISSMFHYSYLVFILLPFIFKLNNKIMIATLLLILYFSSHLILYGIANLDPNMSILVKKAAVYQEMTNDSQTLLIRNLFFIIMLPFVFRYKINDIYSKIYLFYIFLLVCSLPFDEINRRFLFKGALLVVIPTVIFVFRHRLVLPFLFIICIYFNVFLINYNAMYGLLNYKPLIEFKF